MPKKIMKEMKVIVAFEPSRIQEVHLMKAFEVIIPPVKHRNKPKKIEHSHETFFSTTI